VCEGRPICDSSFVEDSTLEAFRFHIFTAYSTVSLHAISVKVREHMYSATLQTNYNRQRMEAELLQQVQQASHDFRSASAESRSVARQRYAEILAAFTELLLGGVSSRTFPPIVRTASNQPCE